jgi:uncharacterized coiled-coil protein SlyX
MKVSTEIIEALFLALQRVENQLTEYKQLLQSKDLRTSALLTEVRELLDRMSTEANTLTPLLQNSANVSERQNDFDRRFKLLEEKANYQQDRLDSLEGTLGNLPERVSKLASALAVFLKNCEEDSAN